MAMLLISRQEAKAQGLKRFFTGLSCKHGHIAERYVLDGNCIECARISGKKGSTRYRENHPEKVNTWLYEKSEEDRRAFWAEQARKQRAKFPEKHKNYEKNRYERDKPKRLARNKVWIENNKQKVLDYHKDYFAEKYVKDIEFNLKHKLRARLALAIKNNQKSGSAVRDLGCTIEFLKQHLESQFVEGMTWDNYPAAWEIDHIKPLASFDLTVREQLLEAVHYTNLQPLFKKDHFEKSIEDLKKKTPYVPSDELLDLFAVEDENPAKE